MAVTSIESKRFNPLSLDAVNFLAADVRGAVGPFLNVICWHCNGLFDHLVGEHE